MATGVNKVVHLMPGQILVAREPTLITTLLGSCVSVCLYSAAHKIGGMSHSVLPSPGNLKVIGDVRYVECALSSMLKELRMLGVSPGNLEAKMFGGADMFPQQVRGGGISRLVGDGNTEAAKKFLMNAGVRVISECTGGTSGMKLIFDTSTGVVLVRMISGCSRKKSGTGRESAV